MTTVFLLPLLFLMILGWIGGDDRAKVADTEIIRKSLRFTGSGTVPGQLVVDNINRAIEVAGYDGEVVELIIHKTIRAESDWKLKEAKEKVALDVTGEAGKIMVYVDAPWRARDGSVNYRGWRYHGFDVECRFEVRVPRRVNLSLSTINRGTVIVENVEGDLDVKNVNGGITVREIAGSGRFSTVNGNVEVSFNRIPLASSTYTTVNGKIDVAFPGNLSADLRLKTFNGSVYTDFEVSSLPSSPPIGDVWKRKKVYRTADSYRVRVGQGGPELSFDTLNGNIYILKNES